MTVLRRREPGALVGLLVILGIAGCGGDGASPSVDAQSAAPTPTPSARAGMAVTDLSVIGCASDDPDGVAGLTGVWQGHAGDLYYVRQVGQCVWWFATELEDIEPGATGQRGFAHVASGRIVGSQLDVEWVDIPLGDILNGGGLTFFYDEVNEQLLLTEQRGGGMPFGDSVLSRFEPSVSPTASPSP